MVPRQRERFDTENIVGAQVDEPNVVLVTPVVQLEHLLRVAAAVTQDADMVWAEIWGELKRLATSGGMIVPEAEEGFVPSCGWPEFLEKFWLLKHYLDSVQRICTKKH